MPFWPSSSSVAESHHWSLGDVAECMMRARRMQQQQHGSSSMQQQQRVAYMVRSRVVRPYSAEMAPHQRRMRSVLHAIVTEPAATPAEGAALGRLAHDVAECVAADAELQLTLLAEERRDTGGGGRRGRPPLSTEQLKFYQRWGFIHLRSAYSADEMHRISVAQNKAATSFANRNHHGHSNPLGWTLAESPTLSRLLLEDDRFLGTMAQLLGEDFICFSTSNGTGYGGFEPDQWEDRVSCGMTEDYQEHGWHTVSNSDRPSILAISACSVTLQTSGLSRSKRSEISTSGDVSIPHGHEEQPDSIFARQSHCRGATTHACPAGYARRLYRQPTLGKT